MQSAKGEGAEASGAPAAECAAESSRATRVKGVYPLWCIGRSVTALSVPDMDAADRVVSARGL